VAPIGSSPELAEVGSARDARSACVHELVAAQAARRPDAVAVRSEQRRLTYAELDARANQLAHHLQSLGVTAETPVALCIPRSLDLIVALLGILKAGGAYLALDPAQPRERHRTLLEDSGARILLVRGAPPAALDGLAETVVRLDRDRALLAQSPATDPKAPVGPEHVAYLAYTSGSTGVPKGAAIPHRAVTRLVVDPDFLTIDEDDVFLQLAPVAFDASTLEIWGPLLNGAVLEVFPPHDPTPEQIAAVAENTGVTVLWLTAGLFHQIADGPIARLSGLRWLLAGGDVLSVPHVERAVAALPNTTLVNGYGPTENTTFTCCHPVRGPIRTESVPIGRPISGTSVYVLDGALRPVPPGEPGELFAGGAGVARGYLGRPALTAERFLPDPFAAGPGARMYRTGDLVRQDPDGTVEFLGRIDNQVKIRGYRVEPGEIEAAIARHQGVRDVAVVAQEDPRGGRRLVAFIAAGRRVAAPALRRELAEALPPYAVPSAFVTVHALPLTPNGKVDRAALARRRVRERPEVSAAYRTPGSGTERALAELWADLLEIPDVGLDDDFFELGGHSLLATRITGEIAAVHGVEVNPRAFYENPTVAELSRLVDQAPKTIPPREAAAAGGEGA
jgi:amino acid adenylation domain-containing protein